MPVEALIVPPRYRDPTLVAHGGMGDVYCATDTVLGRPAALKLLSERYAADGAIRQRFTREALAAARLSGEPNTVTIYDVGEWRGRPFIVMEYLPNGSLEGVLRREGAQRPQRVLAWLEEVARALDRAHAHGVVHRDVKPANLLLDEQEHVHVADFGVASAAGLDSLTETGTVLGTAGYFAPEQAQGRPTTPATDRYALAVVAFELLTGSRPFQRTSAASEATAHVQEPVPSASERRHGLAVEVDAVFERALAKQPGERFVTCLDFVAALRDAFTTAPRVRPIIGPTGARRRRRALPVLLALAGLAALAGGIAAAVIATGGGGGPAAVTVTEHGTTVRETVTAQRPALAVPPSTATTAGSTLSASAGGSGTALALEGYRRLQAGDAAGALSLLQAAARELRGTSSLEEAYNDYNLAVALTRTTGCSAQVLQLLDESEAIQGHRSEIDALRRTCRGHRAG
ncbi:MAG TPA: serine/threonine-protein kinase [Gaiellaceae bacterium]|nr:serine/threonine-protein kinase [Gaiellaceae bacterium]